MLSFLIFWGVVSQWVQILLVPRQVVSVSVYTHDMHRTAAAFIDIPATSHGQDWTFQSCVVASYGKKLWYFLDIYRRYISHALRAINYRVWRVCFSHVLQGVTPLIIFLLWIQCTLYRTQGPVSLVLTSSYGIYVTCSIPGQLCLCHFPENQIPMRGDDLMNEIIIFDIFPLATLVGHSCKW